MLKLVTDDLQREGPEAICQEKAEQHHMTLIKNYIQSHRIRNHSKLTIKKEEYFLIKWFKTHGHKSQMLYTWEAMAAITGREIVLSYIGALIESEISPKTIRNYVGILNRYFSFVIEHPFVKTDNGMQRIDELYGVEIRKPLSEFDIPTHTYDGEDRGIPFDPERLYDFYSLLRKSYVQESRDGYLPYRARNYAILVVAGESGLRIDELIHLEVHDLFFESNKIQTRYAKGSKGSGKRARITLFTPLAKDTLRYYLRTHRKEIIGSSETTLVFPSKTGNILPYSQLQRELKVMVKIAIGKKFPILPHIGWHWLRRIFATRFIERFPDKLAILISMLGHSNANTVHKYVNHSRAWMDDQIKAVLEGSKNWPYIGD